MNNFEKIKSLTLDEMAELYDELNVDCAGYHCPAFKICANLQNCKVAFKQWLQQESEG